jgi:hypothetical protein
MYGDIQTEQFSPDGLDEASIEVLIVEVANELGLDPTRLGGDPLIQRHERRSARRVLGGTVRVLRVHGPLSVPSGTEAA